MGFRIFALCFKQLFVNWKIALRLSWFWTLVLVAIFLTIFNAVSVNLAGLEGGNGMTAGSRLLYFPMGLAFLIAVVIGPISIAIGWHRYVLRGEVPRVLYFFPRRKTLWPYIWRGFKIGVIILLITFALEFLLSFALPLILRNIESVLSAGVEFSLIIVSVMVGILSSTFSFWLFLRMGLGLPGISVGEDISSGESWRRTQTVSGALLTTAVLVAVFQNITSLFANLLMLRTAIQSVDFTENMLLEPALSWNLLPFLIYLPFYIINFFVVFGILTVVYGHLLEGEPI